MIWTTEEIDALQAVRRNSPTASERELTRIAKHRPELRGRTEKAIYARIRQMFGTGGWFAGKPVSHRAI